MCFELLSAKLAGTMLFCCRNAMILVDFATASCSPIQLLIGTVQLYNLSDTIPWEKPKSTGLCLKVESLKKNISNILDTS